MAHYLVTGAAGFIGARVVELLLAAGYSIVGVDNLNDAYDPWLKYWRLDRLKGRERFVFHEVDICGQRCLREIFPRNQKFDAVIHLAARAGVRESVQNPWAYLDTNVTGTLNLLELCRQHRVPKFVLASTSSLYGSGNSLPHDEQTPTDGPFSPYAASKKAAEALCHTYHHLYGIDVTVVRYFTVYGPAGRPDMSVFRFIQWISEGHAVTVYGEGTQSRDFTYIDDIARGTISACRPLGYEVINLGSDRPVALNRTIRLIERLAGRKARIERRPAHRADVAATWASIEKARGLLDWKPATRYEEGLEQCVRWYQANRDWACKVQTRPLSRSAATSP